MPQTGYKTATIRESAYSLAQTQAEREGISVSELVGKAVNSYVHRREDLEERVRIVLSALDSSEGSSLFRRSAN